MNASRTFRRFHTPKRIGFTLIEVLIALGVTGLLVILIQSAISVYRQVRVTGREQIEQAQIVRAVYRKIEVDIRSVIFSVEETQEQGTDQEESADGSNSSSEVTDASDAVSRSSVGIVGTADALVLHISRPPRDMNYLSFQETGDLTSRSSDLISVTYLLADSNGGSLAQAVTNFVSESQTTSHSSVLGLARLEGDRFAMENADENGNIDELAKTANLLAPEVVQLQFAYFDGEEWQESWDSKEIGALPRAVKVSMAFRLPGYDENPQAVHLQEIVIAVPLSDPKALMEDSGL